MEKQPDNIIALENELIALGLMDKAREIYAELGGDAAISYVESSYRLLSKVYHPDKNPKNSETSKKHQQRLNNLKQLFLSIDNRVFFTLLEKGTLKASSPKKKILIVEDELSLKEVFRDVFIMEGYDVKVAGDGKEGLRIYNQFKPDIVFTDVVMPKMTGIELAAELRKLDPKIKIVFVTGYFDIQKVKSDLDENILKYGYPCLSKPFKISEMLEIVDTYLKEKKEINLYV